MVSPVNDLEALVAAQPLVDHHVHGALASAVPREIWESMLTEAPVAPNGFSVLDSSQVGFAIRRWCAPLLGLEAHAPSASYWSTRVALGEDEVTRRLLARTGVSAYLLETGYLGDAVTPPAHFSELSGARTFEVVRLETEAEVLLASGVSAAGLVDDYADHLAQRCGDAVGVKSIIAYRYGFDIPAERPSRAEAIAAAGRTLEASGESGVRVADPVLLRWLLWCGVDQGLPIQLHSGYGDPDLDLHRADPLLLMPWLRLVEPTGVPVMLLHNYPYHRQAGYLAQVFANVYCDVGLAVNYTGTQSRQVIAESLRARALPQAAVLIRRLGSCRAAPARLGALAPRDRLGRGPVGRGGGLVLRRRSTGRGPDRAPQRGAGLRSRPPLTRQRAVSSMVAGAAVLPLSSLNRNMKATITTAAMAAGMTQMPVQEWPSSVA